MPRKKNEPKMGRPRSSEEGLAEPMTFTIKPETKRAIDEVLVEDEHPSRSSALNAIVLANADRRKKRKAKTK
jgi:hypothetical protein